MAESTESPPKARAEARFGIANAHYRSGNREQARLAWLEAAEKSSDQPDIACESFLRAGNLAAASRNLDSALTTYEKAVHIQAISPTARAFAAEARLRIGKVHLARRVEGKRLLTPAVAAFEAVVQEYPEQTDMVAEAKMQLVALKLEFAINGKAPFREAQALAEDFAKTYPEDTARIPTVRLIRAESLFHQGQYDSAISEIRLLQERYPASGQPFGTARFLLAQCYDRKGDYARAIMEYQTFLYQITESFSAWEERPGALYGIAMCHRALGRVKEADSTFQQLRREYPTSYFVKMAESRIGGVR